MEQVLFGFLAAMTLGGAVVTISARSPLRSAFALLVSLLSLGGLYVTLLAHFVAAMQLLVYAGAIMVLFVLVIMLLNLSAEELGERVVTVQAVVAGVVLLLVGGKFAKVLLAWGPGRHETGAGFGEEFGSIGAVGELLFRQFLMPFELTSILLLVAAVGAVVIARRRLGREAP